MTESVFLPEALSISGRRMETLIRNAHRLLGKRYKQTPLWAIVADLTGHGSTISGQMCSAANLDPCQPCSNKKLKDRTGNPK